jgi:hypothetical protein
MANSLHAETAGHMPIHLGFLKDPELNNQFATLEEREYHLGY